MNKFLLGWALAQTLITIFCIFLLYKKPTTHNEIENLKQKNKRNRASDIDNDISADITREESKKERKRWIKRRNKNK